MKQTKLLFLALCPAILVTIIYELFLGHRHDYSGHYVAGYGATFTAAMFLLRIAEPTVIKQRLTLFVIPFCIVCILGGAIAEATVFRLAKFDEIDFFNQSIGAVLATICASAYITAEPCSNSEFNSGMVVGIGFLAIGGFLAFA